VITKPNQASTSHATLPHGGVIAAAEDIETLASGDETLF
jgi:hypothetical protein